MLYPDFKMRYACLGQVGSLIFNSNQFVKALPHVSLNVRPFIAFIKLRRKLPHPLTTRLQPTRWWTKTPLTGSATGLDTPLSSSELVLLVSLRRSGWPSSLSSLHLLCQTSTDWLLHPSGTNLWSNGCAKSRVRSSSEFVERWKNLFEKIKQN